MEVTISRDSYNLKEWRKAVFLRCMEDNPEESLIGICRLLGISKHTLRVEAKSFEIELRWKRKDLYSLALKNDLEKISKFNKNEYGK